MESPRPPSLSRRIEIQTAPQMPSTDEVGPPSWVTSAFSRSDAIYLIGEAIKGSAAARRRAARSVANAVGKRAYESMCQSLSRNIGTAYERDLLYTLWRCGCILI